MEETIKDEGLGEVINTVEDLIAQTDARIKQAAERKLISDNYSYLSATITSSG